MCGSREHDSVALYVDVQDAVEEMPDSPATEVVNAAISLFAIALPLQAPKVQESILEQMATSLSTTSLQRDPARKAAMTVNIAVALLATSKVAVGETRCDPGNLKRSEVERPLQDLLHVRSLVSTVLVTTTNDQSELHCSPRPIRSQHRL